MFLSSLVIIALLNACEKETFSVQPSNQIEQLEYAITDFDEIELSHEFTAEIQFSDTQERVTIEANENLQDLILVEKQGNKLKIGMKPNTSIRGNTVLKAYISAKAIHAYTLSGESQVLVQETIAGEQVSVRLTGESRFQANLDVNNLKVDVTGGSMAQLSGAAQLFDMRLTGESDILDFNFSCDDLIANLAGESTARLSVAKTININAAGESTLFYKGNATIQNQTLAGNSKLKKVN